jgi:hypothetical protein
MRQFWSIAHNRAFTPLREIFCPQKRQDAVKEKGPRKSKALEKNKYKMKNVYYIRVILI